MIKHLLAVFFSFVFIANTKAQFYGNEWINYSQKYYKIKIVKNGIYRIDSLTLASEGIPVGTIDARNFQIFNKGKEQPVYIKGESDGVLNTSDFIEFYAAKNDGELDTALYVYTPSLPNPYYSMINDTAIYYLTWNASFTNNRMQLETDTSFSAFPVAPYFLKTDIIENHGYYYNGETDVVGGTDSRFVRSEGWGGPPIGLGSVDAYYFHTTNRYLSGPDAILTTKVIGASKDENLLTNSLPDHHLTIQYNGNLVVDTIFSGYESNLFIKHLPMTMLNEATSDVVYKSVADANFKSNRTFMVYATVNYPHTFNLEGKGSYLLTVPDQGTLKTQLKFNNFNSISGIATLYDLTNSKRISVFKSGTDYRALIPNSGKEKNCLLIAEDSIIKIKSIKPVTASAQFTDYMNFATDSAFIIVTHKLVMSSALSYKVYRSTNKYGGHHHVVMADIDELYDQFAHGVVKSPLSIRRFCKFLLDRYPTAPENLFLMGKSYHLHDYRQNPALAAGCLVPSFGYPSSDNLLTAGLVSGYKLSPAIATGRLAAQSNLDVDIYLNKILQFENRTTNPPAEWMKQVLHFGGGMSLYEQNQLKSYLDYYKTVIQDTLFGGKVKDFFKTSSSPIQINTSDTLKQLINNGVALMTFFGHAYGSGFDQSIDDVSAYNPVPGHYPFLLANSCYSGDLHAYNPGTGYALSSSEMFVLAPNKGTIGYLGAVSLGVPYALNVFSSNFYDELSVKNYGKSVGSTIKRAMQNIQSQALSDSLIRQACYDMTLHGDPSVKISPMEKPDYTVTNNSIYFDQHSDVDSFKVYVEITNLGKAINDSIVTEITRTFPTGETQRYLIRHRAPKFKDTISIKLWNDYAKGIGLNKINAITDSYSTIAEVNETNNATNPGASIIINGGSIAPVYPYNFAIIPKDSVTLKASTADAFAASKNYIFQFDTTDTYNSPSLLVQKIKAPGGVISWHPPVKLIPSKVYYWRVSPDSTSPSNGYNWREFSFQYIPNKRGWEQAHFFQFKGDEFQYVKFNRAKRKFDFFNDTKSISCINGMLPYIPFTSIQWKLNDLVKSYWTCLNANSGMNIAVIDPVTGENWQTTVVSPLCSNCNNGLYGNTQCRDYPYNSFEFLDVDAPSRNNITNFLTNVVPNGFYVLAYSLNRLKLPYESSVYSSFELIGASKFRSLQSEVPYIVFGKKGAAPGSARELIGSSESSNLRLDTTITTNWNDGYIASPVIGPAQRWDSLSWAQHTMDGGITYDSIAVRLIGIRYDGKEFTLGNFDKNTTEVGNLSSFVDAKVFPTIRLVAYLKDDTLHTPAQLERWQVMYTPVPELAINPAAGYTINDSVSNGENIVMRLPIQNISEYPFTDSLLVNYWIEDDARVIHALPSRLKKNSFAPGEILIDTVVVNSLPYKNVNALWVEVNPLNQPRSQTEQYHFNNISRSALFIEGDKINPLLDVTFDGLHILNNDLVSAKPSILIQLKDENKYLALNDTNDFKVFLSSPGSATSKRIFFGPTMTFVPAVLPNNSCRINYKPDLNQDGTYQLLVQAKDKSKNLSGNVDYKINFEVVNASTITQVMNYPNPFSTSTRFVFTLTGSELPTNFKIQIMTITGKVVREIFEDELGPLHVGRNITEFAWNGRDQFGDQLANGVYLYRVLTKINGWTIDKKETSADKYFKNGWGKMYLMR
jgi:hypothetical protein